LVIQTELAVFSLLDPSLDNSWIYLRSQVPGTMTATNVMMRAAMDQKKLVIQTEKQIGDLLHCGHLSYGSGISPEGIATALASRSKLKSSDGSMAEQ